jgi:hypothetical protein
VLAAAMVNGMVEKMMVIETRNHRSFVQRETVHNSLARAWLGKKSSL